MPESEKPYSVDDFTNDLALRFWGSVETGEPDKCWPWRQSVASHGYGQTFDGTTVRLAHRVAWVLSRGPIPPLMTVDHLCRNRVCCNPSHFRLLTNVANATDNGQGRKTHCPQGHPYDDANTRRNSMGHRSCRECRNARRRAA